MSGDRSHACPSPGCEVRIPRHLFACRTHWYALPAELRAEINATWKAQDMRAWVRAAKEARRILEERVA